MFVATTHLGFRRTILTVDSRSFDPCMTSAFQNKKQFTNGSVERFELCEFLFTIFSMQLATTMCMRQMVKVDQYPNFTIDLKSAPLFCGLLISLVGLVICFPFPFQAGASTHLRVPGGDGSKMRDCISLGIWPYTGRMMSSGTAGPRLAMR